MSDSQITAVSRIAKFSLCLTIAAGLLAIAGCTPANDSATDATGTKASDSTNNTAVDHDREDQVQEDQVQEDQGAGIAKNDRAEQQDESAAKPDQTLMEIPEDWVRLIEDRELWIDQANKVVIVGGQICLNHGMLELLACSMETKTHEAVVSANATAQEVHAALLAIGAKPGHPVEFDPEYKPAEGTSIQVDVKWHAAGDWKKLPAQQFVRNTETKELLSGTWVFGGSREYTDPDTGDVYYYGNSGDFICVSNFPSATLDLPIKSSNSTDALIFEVNRDVVPAIGTHVYLLLSIAPAE